MITRKELVNIMRQSNVNGFNKQFDFMVGELKKQTNCDECKDIKLKKTEFRARWAKASRNNTKFEKINQNWLNTSLSFSRHIKHVAEKKRGRPPI